MKRARKLMGNGKRLTGNAQQKRSAVPHFCSFQFEEFFLPGSRIFAKDLFNRSEGNAFFAEVLVDPAEKLRLLKTHAFAKLHVGDKPEMHPLIVPIPINFRFFEIGAVPIPINRSEAEIGAALITIQEKNIKIRAVLVDHSGN